MASDDEYEEYISDEMAVENLESLIVHEPEYDYKILEPNDVVKEMLEIITKVSDIMQISKPKTRILLHHMSWDDEKLLEKFYDGDREQLFQAAQMVNPENCKKTRKSSVGSTEYCEICLSPLPKDLMTGLECGHRFCEDCWDQYLSVKVMQEGECLSISCPAHKCDILVDDVSAMELIKDPKVKSKYQHLITQSFVECNRLLKWCPTPGCECAIKVQYIDYKPVKCHCGQKICFKCTEKWHAPILCEYLIKWLKKLEEDVASSVWIKMNTKNCPNCYVSIEKTGGCNHMTCRKCKHEFCWICNVNWKHHNVNYRCNRFQGKEVVQNAESVAALNKFIFYSDRYKLQMMSKELEMTLYNVVGTKMVELQDSMSMSWVQVQFLKKAVDALCQSRQVLMYSYAFAYYVHECNQKAIFEDNQRDLEEATEKLSGYLEQEMINDNLEILKQRLQDNTYYCEMRMKALIDHVYEGYRRNKKWWTHIDAV